MWINFSMLYINNLIISIRELLKGHIFFINSVRTAQDALYKKAHYTTTVCFLRNSPQWGRASSFTRFLDHTRRRTTGGRTPLDEWSACRRDLYLTSQNTHNRQTSMPPVGFEPTISAGERPQTYALDRAATGTGTLPLCLVYFLHTTQ